MVKALGLVSGGLDSILAVKVLEEQAIDITALSFTTPFFNAENAKNAARLLGIPIIVRDIREEHFRMLLKPKHGYGSGMNPCIDCHALMLKIAGDIMKKDKFDFIFTGEILGERPMSQNKQSLYIVAKESGCADYVLRPLSAKLLPETKPEREGKIDRSRLLDMAGRQRKRQFEMAKKYNIKNPPTPGSGCLLTDPCFSGRLKDLLNEKENITLRDIELLKVGRHIRLDKSNKMVIGRNQEDNSILRKIADNKKYILFTPQGVRGPNCVVSHELSGELLDEAMKRCASYCDAREGDEVRFLAVNINPRRKISVIYSKSNRPKEFIGT